LLIDWIEQQYKHGAEIASMCTGIFMLASPFVPIPAETILKTISIDTVSPFRQI
jgi:hypothetical protein